MDVAEELLDVDRTVDRLYVERRLDDWRERIEGLYAQMGAWLPAGWTLSDGGTVPIHEDPMVKFGMAQRLLPRRTVFRNGEAVGYVEPRGLWIIGANGRVDVVVADRHYLLIDRADSFEGPDWQVSPITARRDRMRLTRDAVAQIFR